MRYSEASSLISRRASSPYATVVLVIDSSETDTLVVSVCVGDACLPTNTGVCAYFYSLETGAIKLKLSLTQCVECLNSLSITLFDNLTHVHTITAFRNEITLKSATW